MEWDFYWLNYGLVIVATLLFISTLGKTLHLLPILSEGVFRSKNNIDLEDSMRLVRDRNLLVGIMLLISTLILSKYGILQNNIVPFRFQILVQIAGVIIFIFVRHILIILSYGLFRDKDKLQIANRLGGNFVIVFAIFSLCIVFISKMLRLSGEVINHLLLGELIIFYLLFIIRKVQILKNIYNQFVPILYLCTLEIVPAILLVYIQIFYR